MADHWPRPGELIGRTPQFIHDYGDNRAGFTFPEKQAGPPGNKEKTGKAGKPCSANSHAVLPQHSRTRVWRPTLSVADYHPAGRGRPGMIRMVQSWLVLAALLAGAWAGAGRCAAAGVAGRPGACCRQPGTWPRISERRSPGDGDRWHSRPPWPDHSCYRSTRIAMARFCKATRCWTGRVCRRPGGFRPGHRRRQAARQEYSDGPGGGGCVHQPSTAGGRPGLVGSPDWKQATGLAQGFGEALISYHYSFQRRVGNPAKFRRAGRRREEPAG